MYRIITIGFFSFITHCAVVAQHVSDDRIKELLRNEQLLGRWQVDRSLTVNANQVPINVLDSVAGSGGSYLVKKKLINIRLLSAGIVQQFSSKVPYDWNGGALLPARGYQLVATVGVYSSIGKHIGIQLAPEFVSAVNKDYERFSQQLGERAWADRYRFWNTIDIPEQFGTGNYSKVLPGQSFIKYKAKNIAFGLSTENLWWGPGYRNALIMSTNAPGFLHWTVETIKPIKTGIGEFEGQIIGGTLSSSSFLPPRINSVYNGSFVYIPKQEKARYMTGMVATWHPKWTPGLFLGIAKASYLYSSDISNPLDALPMQGFFGHSLTRTEKNGKKASLGSLFIRYLMPRDNAELYIEYGRKDRSLMPWNIIQANAYRRAYVAGLRKLFPIRNQAHMQLAVELTQLQAPTAELIRDPDSWYSHRYVRQGYTHMGRPLGAGIGSGSNSQTLELSWVKGLKRIGLQFERIRYNSDFYYYAFEYLQEFRRHWIDLSTTLKIDWQLHNWSLSGQLGLVRSYNYKWLIIQVDPNNFFTPGNEILNIEGRVALRYRL